jgi:ABC-type transport system involved in multi-copper enzyme maturation permease subunit
VTRLLRAELRRFVGRDVVRMFAAAVLVGIVIGAVITAVNSRITASDEATYRSELQRCLDGRYVPENRLPRRYDTLAQYCADNVRPEYFGGGDQRFELADLPDILKGAGILVVIGGLLLGASFVGAEWHAGTMTTLLTWEPRRIRVLLAKSIVAAVCVFVLMVVLLTLFALALTLVASTRGITEHLGEHFLRSVAGTVLRVAACSSAGALVGMAIAMLTRSTAASVAIGFGYLALIEGLVRALRPGWQHYLLADNIAVVITGADSGIMQEPVTFTHALVTVAAWVVTLTVAAGAAFRARDVN